MITVKPFAVSRMLCVKCNGIITPVYLEGRERDLNFLFRALDYERREYAMGVDYLLYVPRQKEFKLHRIGEQPKIEDPVI
jgi:hypothetical protein